MVDINVNGKAALITGGTRGLGYFIAESFVLNGASTIIITSRKAQACEDAKSQLEKLASENGKSVKIISIPCDLSNEASTVDFFRKVSSQISKLDVLIANAGATYGASLPDHPVSAVKKVLDLNIAGVFHSIQLFQPLLEKSGSKEDPSRIVVVSSVAAAVSTDFGGTYGYLASKAGVSHLARNLAIQLGPRNINVNILAPGFFETKMTKFLVKTKSTELTSGNPLGRFGNPDDIKNAVLWLCCRQSSYINGITLPVDGGLQLVGTSNLSKL
jgi:NAD(P)-dependent dehydrogenase (short-subunit alcohol dehydrogenase family)